MDFDSRVYFIVFFYCTIVQNPHGIGKILKRRNWEILAQPTTTGLDAKNLLSILFVEFLAKN